MDIITQPQYIQIPITTQIIDETYMNIADVIDDLHILQLKLNMAKDLLNKYEGDKRYFKFSRKIFPFNDMKYHLQEDYGLSFITNAWLKTYELLSTIKDSLPIEMNESYKIFFNANAPGASTIAAEYFFQHQTQLNLDWVASSYMDGEETLDDQYGLIVRYREKWLMDETNNGDVRDISNIEDFVTKINKKFNRKVDLYFSDIAINIGNDYNNEERLEVKEVFGQNITGLMTLRIGGIMIVKQRSFLLPLNMWMISFMSQFFNTFNIHKPITSRSYNSEVYLVGIGFKGMHSEDADFLVHILNNLDEEMIDTFPSSPFKSSVIQLYHAAARITDIQCMALQACVGHYETHKNKMAQFYSHIHAALCKSRTQFIKDHNIVAVLG